MVQTNVSGAGDKQLFYLRSTCFFFFLPLNWAKYSASFRGQMLNNVFELVFTIVRYLNRDSSDWHDLTEPRWRHSPVNKKVGFVRDSGFQTGREAPRVCSHHGLTLSLPLCRSPPFGIGFFFLFWDYRHHCVLRNFEWKLYPRLCWIKNSDTHEECAHTSIHTFWIGLTHTLFASHRESCLVLRRMIRK